MTDYVNNCKKLTFILPTITQCWEHTRLFDINKRHFTNNKDIVIQHVTITDTAL